MANPAIRVTTAPDKRICQGDVLRDVEYIESITEHRGILEVSKIVFPYVVVLTQDCDLESDHIFRTERKQTQDKWLISVLVAPLYNASHVFTGEHLSKLGLKSEPINEARSPGRVLRENQNPRYHYLEFPEPIPIVASVIDFKHYFSASLLYLQTAKKARFVCTISELYREDISHRFSSFLSRIGLPDVRLNA